MKTLFAAVLLASTVMSFGAANAAELTPNASEAASVVIEKIFEKVCIEIPLFAFLQKRDWHRPSRCQSLG